MTKIEALELELAARKMVEGTELGWVEVLRQKECHGYVCNNLMLYTDVDLALGIIEGKPVWPGGKHFDSRGRWHIAGGKYTQAYLDTCSWNPPTQKTKTFKHWWGSEEFGAPVYTHSMYFARMGWEACRKALEGLK